jgi:hypothetical protein
MDAKCCKPSKGENLKEGGAPLRVLVWIDEWMSEVECGTKEG